MDRLIEEVGEVLTSIDYLAKFRDLQTLYEFTFDLRTLFTKKMCSALQNICMQFFRFLTLKVYSNHVSCNNFSFRTVEQKIKSMKILEENIINANYQVKTSYCQFFKGFENKKGVGKVEKICFLITLICKEVLKYTMEKINTQKFMEARKKESNTSIQKNELNKEDLSVEEETYIVLVYLTLGTFVSQHAFKCLKKKYIKQYIFKSSFADDYDTIVKSLAHIRSTLSQKDIGLVKTREQNRDKYPKSNKMLDQIQLRTFIRSTFRNHDTPKQKSTTTFETAKSITNRNNKLHLKNNSDVNRQSFQSLDFNNSIYQSDNNNRQLIPKISLMKENPIGKLSSAANLNYDLPKRSPTSICKKFVSPKKQIHFDVGVNKKSGKSQMKKVTYHMKGKQSEKKQWNYSNHNLLKTVQRTKKTKFTQIHCENESRPDGKDQCLKSSRNKTMNSAEKIFKKVSKIKNMNKLPIQKLENFHHFRDLSQHKDYERENNEYYEARRMFSVERLTEGKDNKGKYIPEEINWKEFKNNLEELTNRISTERKAEKDKMMQRCSGVYEEQKWHRLYNIKAEKDFPYIVSNERGIEKRSREKIGQEKIYHKPSSILKGKKKTFLDQCQKRNKRLEQGIQYKIKI